LPLLNKLRIIKMNDDVAANDDDNNKINDDYDDYRQ
jgi:hypothetical protein